jgi:hypothetical protein
MIFLGEPNFYMKVDYYLLKSGGKICNQDKWLMIGQ